MKWTDATHLADGFGIGPLLRPVVRGLREQAEYLGRLPRAFSQGREIRSYLAKSGFKGLHIGASDKSLPGWLNTDLSPKMPGVTYLNAAARFPISDCAFDAIFSEHFIEHIDRTSADICLSEAFRCLKPGGVLRFATPDLSRYVQLFAANRTTDEDRFLDEGSKFYKWQKKNACHALNHVVYNWGHRFLYTEEELCDALRTAGFETLTSVEIGQSDHPELRNLEQHANFNGEIINAFETMIVEATKPVTRI